MYAFLVMAASLQGSTQSNPFHSSVNPIAATHITNTFIIDPSAPLELAPDVFLPISLFTVGIETEAEAAALADTNPESVAEGNITASAPITTSSLPSEIGVPHMISAELPRRISFPSIASPLGFAVNVSSPMVIIDGIGLGSMVVNNEKARSCLDVSNLYTR